MKYTGDKTSLYLCIVVLTLATSRGNVIKLDDANSITLDSDETVKPEIDTYILETSVRHFAIHGLCSHSNGQKYFYQVMKSKLYQLKGAFVADLVSDMCLKGGEELYKWVAELFDINGDGYISHIEKQIYKYYD